MAKYRKKPVVVEAAQWFKNGDHPAVEPWSRRRSGKAKTVSTMRWDLPIRRRAAQRSPCT